MIGWVIAGLIGIPFVSGIIKGAIQNRRPSRYEENLKQVIAEREAREAAGLPPIDIRTKPGDPNSRFQVIVTRGPRERAAQAPKILQKYAHGTEKLALEAVAAGPPRDQDLADCASLGRRIQVKPAVPAVIRYTSREGEITCRTVDITAIEGSFHRDGSVSLIAFHAYCHTRKDERTFYFGSVEAAADPYTGREIPHFGTYVMRKMNRTDYVRRWKDR